MLVGVPTNVEKIHDLSYLMINTVYICKYGIKCESTSLVNGMYMVYSSVVSASKFISDMQITPSLRGEVLSSHPGGYQIGELTTICLSHSSTNMEIAVSESDRIDGGDITVNYIIL